MNKNSNQYNSGTDNKKVFFETEIALIFFGCSTCPSAKDERIPVILNQLSLRIKQKARNEGIGYTFIGLSNEYNLNKGINYITSIADFDEISIGNNMKNTALRHYIWDNFDHPLSASTPQIIISKRSYELSNIKTRINPSSYISDKIILRKIGVSDIKLLLNERKYFDEIFLRMNEKQSAILN